jgi:hypothetical protein
MIMEQKVLDNHLSATAACVNRELNGLNNIDKLTVLSTVVAVTLYNSAPTPSVERAMVLAHADDLLTMLKSINKGGQPRQREEVELPEAEELKVQGWTRKPLSDEELSELSHQILPPHLEKSSEDLAVAIRFFVIASAVGDAK